VCIQCPVHKEQGVVAISAILASAILWSTAAIVGNIDEYWDIIDSAVLACLVCTYEHSLLC